MHAPNARFPELGHFSLPGTDAPTDYNQIIKFNVDHRAIIFFLRLLESQSQEMIMEKIFDTSDNALIDLGSVSEETRGSTVGIEDTNGGRHPGIGLTND